MYADPAHIRNSEVKIRMRPEVRALLDAHATYNKRQRAVLAFELMYEGLIAREQRIRLLKANGSR